MANPLAYFTQKITVNFREGEQRTTITRSGDYNPKTDTFVSTAFDRGARQMIVENASQIGSIRFDELGESPAVAENSPVNQA